MPNEKPKQKRNLNSLYIYNIIIYRISRISPVPVATPKKKSPPMKVFRLFIHSATTLVRWVMMARPENYSFSFHGHGNFFFFLLCICLLFWVALDADISAVWARVWLAAAVGYPCRNENVFVQFSLGWVGSATLLVFIFCFLLLPSFWPILSHWNFAKVYIFSVTHKKKKLTREFFVLYNNVFSRSLPVTKKKKEEKIDVFYVLSSVRFQNLFKRERKIRKKNVFWETEKERETVSSIFS